MFSIIPIVLIMLILLCLDAIYMFLFKDLFIKNIERVQSGRSFEIDYFAALITYILLSTGLYYFIIQQKKPLKDAFLFGLCIYAIYEFTNLSIFKDWNMKVVLVDTLWGGILMCLTTFIFYQLSFVFSSFA